MVQYQRGVKRAYADRPVIHAHHGEAVQGDEIAKRIGASPVPLLESRLFHLARAYFLLLLHRLHSRTCVGRIDCRIDEIRKTESRDNYFSRRSDNLMRRNVQEVELKSSFTERAEILMRVQWKSAPFQSDRERREGLAFAKVPDWLAGAPQSGCHPVPSCTAPNKTEFPPVTCRVL